MDEVENSVYTHSPQRDVIPCNATAVPDYLLTKKILRAFENMPYNKVSDITTHDTRKKVSCKSDIILMIEPYLDRMDTEHLQETFCTLEEKGYLSCYKLIISFKR